MKKKETYNNNCSDNFTLLWKNKALIVNNILIKNIKKILN